MHICCLYVDKNTWEDMPKYVFMYACIYDYIHSDMYVGRHTWDCMSMYACMYECMYVYIVNTCIASVYISATVHKFDLSLSKYGC